ncbi:MAG TPA: c-type cytochrome [Bryobacteraceae bacterium]|jgi:mono/diheme cytochrome c family protein
MNQLARFSLAAFLVFAAEQTHSAIAQQPAIAQAAKAGKTDDVGGGDVARGKYIVENVAMCTRCHTPGGDRREPDRAHWLQGAPIRSPEPNFAVYAPRLAGRPPGTDQEFVTLLTTGISRTGAPPRPPMPSFRMTRPDAESVLAYLKSLSK